MIPNECSRLARVTRSSASPDDGRHRRSKTPNLNLRTTHQDVYRNGRLTLGTAIALPRGRCGGRGVRKTTDPLFVGAFPAWVEDGPPAREAFVLDLASGILDVATAGCRT